MNFQTDALPDRDSTPVTKKSKQSNDKLLTNPNILSSNHKSNHETKLSNTTTNTDTSNAPGSLSRQSSFQAFLSLHSLRSNSCLCRVLCTVVAAAYSHPVEMTRVTKQAGKNESVEAPLKVHQLFPLLCLIRVILGEKEDKSGHNKGLRHFSLKVCQKVETKRTTSYNEVADELVGGTFNWNAYTQCLILDMQKFHPQVNTLLLLWNRRIYGGVYMMYLMYSWQ